MDLASLRAISICLFVVVIAALDSTPCHTPREYTGRLWVHESRPKAAIC